MKEDATVDAKNPLKETDWQYDLVMAPLLKQQTTMLLANRLLLFGYVFLICFASVGIIGYTRSQSMGIANAQAFDDIRKLGADRCYQRELMKKQIRKVYVLPTIIGTVLLLVYEGMILSMNDKTFSSADLKVMAMLAASGVIAAVYQYVIYRASVKKVGSFLKLNS